MMTSHWARISIVSILSSLAACSGGDPEGLAPAQPAATTVKLDFAHRPLPDIPLPNDLATRYDESSPTRRRVNASMVAPTALESRVRRLADQIDGWGVLQTITIPFTGPIDVESILRAHRDADYDLSNDVIYLVNVTPTSEHYGQLHHLDLGNGNYPVVLERQEYWKNDPRGWTLSLAYEEADEDLDGNGRLDPGEDTDADGELDLPNYLPGRSPARDDLAGRSDALMSFYERATNTVIARPMVPLDERTTYAVVVTRRLHDADGAPVGSPYPWINHAAQTEPLRALVDVLPEGLALDDVAFAFTFTTQSIESDWIAVRDGLYGRGVQAHLGARFPAQLDGLEILRDPEIIRAKNPYVIYTEDVRELLADAAKELLDQDEDSQEFADFLEGLQYVDYQVVGTYSSPQLFQRTDSSGALLPLDDQSWPPDLSTTPAATRPETVYFWLTVPRREVSARGEGKPAPVVVLSHGYTSSRLELFAYAGEFAKHGLATLAIDCVSHGIGLDPVRQEVVKGMFTRTGFTPFLDAIFKDRAADLNNDEIKDSGADFWTSYLFHTRDVVRQSVVDHMQLLRILKTFDGQSRWSLDVDGDGASELAGDFDADGQVDIGGPDGLVGMTGGSLGGIMSTVVAALEPAVKVTVPIAGGGGLSDVGIRSLQGGVREAVALRLLGPLFVGTIEPETGSLRLETIIPDLNDDATHHLADVPGVEIGDTMVVTNLTNGELGCGYVDAEGRVRTGLQSDRGDAIEVAFYRGRALEDAPGCGVLPSERPYRVVNRFEKSVDFQRQLSPAGSPLVTLAEGYGLPRANPRLRRFMSLTQLVLDPSDPGVLARALGPRPITYPATGEQTSAHVIVVTTVGDMNVPASTGGTIGRAAGLVDYLTPDPRYGKPVNQVLIDTFTYEAVDKYKRFADPNGAGVHLDVENFAEGDDLWTGQIPRLDPPLRIGLDKTDAKGGVSAAIFPYPRPSGQHGFAQPGGQTQTARDRCQRACTDPAGCDCSAVEVFDLGRFMFNLLGQYFASGGTRVSLSRCNAFNDCAWEKPMPAARPIEDLR